ncbi:MAG TPA: right-handed parallel beta-helix repeat-containing protein [Gaiellaceae bacterium]
MSYTLRGRIESRLVATLPPLLVAVGIHRWWAIELLALMLAFGLALDVSVYDRVLDYQPAWLALPFGALELGLIVLATRMPLTWRALGLFALGWVTAQVCAHAVFPRARLEYAESGGELGRIGTIAAATVGAAAFAGVAGAVAVLPPTVHLHGVVQGPLLIDHAQTLVGGTVRGGIVVRASHVTLKDVTVIGGQNGIDVDDASHVMLDGVRVTGVTLDGIHVRRSSVMIEDCVVSAPGGPWVQGIDLSFAMDKTMSMVEGCSISGVREGIVTHWMMVDLRRNHVSRTTLRGIDMGEMSMGSITHNTVVDSKGVGILCLDHSECEISRNTISRAAQPIQSQFFAEARVRDNRIE